MAQFVSTTTGIANLDINYLASVLQGIRNNLAASKTLKGADLLNLVWVYNTWLGHNHAVADYYYVAYGNTPPVGTTAVTAWTTGVVGAAYMDSTTFYAGAFVNTNAMRVLCNYINSFKWSHYHQINDGWY